jgi:hypothetical protein
MKSVMLFATRGVFNTVTFERLEMVERVLASSAPSENIGMNWRINAWPVSRTVIALSQETLTA